MNNFLSSSFSTSVPLASVIFSILYMIYGNIGLYILAAICLIIPGLVFLFISAYLFIQFERHVTIELELDTINALEEIGWKYEFQIGMKMTRFIGLSTENIVNRVYDENKETYMKVEPVLVFKKE